MKKNLLLQLLFIVIFIPALIAQNNNRNASLCEAAVGSSPNQLTAAFGHKTNLWYDKDVDVLSFVFAYDTANIGYAFSLDHGVTWSVDTMLYRAPSAADRGRYPQGLIYNPAGNTNPSNAYVTCFGTTGTLNAHYEGTALIGSGANQQTIYPFTSYPRTLFPQGGTIVKNTGTTWWCAEGTTNGTVYNDTVVLAKGTFGGGNFSYSYTTLPVPVCTDNNGDKMFRNQAIIFDDSGQNGYVVVIGNDWTCANQPLDSAMGLIIFKTIDGGNTWNREPIPQLAVDPILLNNGTTYTASTQLDLAMDQNNVLHIGLPVVPFSTGNVIYPSYPWGSWGLFDITFDGGTYFICLIAKPENYYGEFGVVGVGPVIDEDNRFQLSRNWDGSKLFYTWFDTDTNLFGSVGNLFPDMHSIGYDLQTNLYTAEVNFTTFSGTSADGNSIFGNVSYYTINDGTDENIPLMTDVMITPPTSTGDPISFFYEGCTPMNNYVNNGTCINIPIIPWVKNVDGGNINLSVNINYPNPFSKQTFIDVSLIYPTDITVEVTNALGQVFSSTSYPNMRSGKNTLMIDGSSLSKGLYFYTVKAGNDAVTKMMSVE